jgi:cation diffusion facilitator CzcD-associated flavoprotein CzcO
MPEVVDYLIIGAGPAGLQLGYFLHRAGRDYVILEAGATPGTFYRDFPRHRQMISINKPHTGWDDPELNLRMDWNSLISDDPNLLFTRYTDRYFPHADDYLRYLGDFAAGHGLNVEFPPFRRTHPPSVPLPAEAGAPRPGDTMALSNERRRA